MRPAIHILSLSVLVALSGLAFAAPKHAAKPAAAKSAPAPAPLGSNPATVYKDNVGLRQAASSTAPSVGALAKGSPVDVQRQEGLWFNVKAAPGVGYVKINEIRLTQANSPKGGFSMFSSSHTSEAAAVRGLDETKIRGGAMDPQQLSAMEALRVDDAAANSYAGRMHLARTNVAYKDEPGVGKGHLAPSGGSSEEVQMKQAETKAAKVGVLSMIGGRVGLGASASTAADALPKSEQEKVDEEISMGPQVAGRMLGAAPLWNNPEAQRRVNTIGRWVAMQTPRDDLPWTFGIIASDEVNAFAAPGGYVFMTSAMYDLLQSDDEVAAVLGHEISHVVARDHYNVIHKQAMASTGMSMLANKIGSHGNALEQRLTDYFAKQGASIVLNKFDQAVEYRSDAGALVYTSRAGYNPLAMYAVLQKLASLDESKGYTKHLYETHPTATSRLDRLDKSLANVEQYGDRPYVAGY